jgi:hypothetical protein
MLRRVRDRERRERIRTEGNAERDRSDNSSIGAVVVVVGGN